jgi:peptide/nickel transport system ATP-binding protein
MALVEHEIATRNMGTVLITHNLGLAAKYCKRIAVMYQGQLVEVGETEQIFYEPKHPYTVVLVASTPARMNDFVELAGALEQWSKFKAEEMPTEKGY